MATHHAPLPPPGTSVNDGINNLDFPLRYSTVFDAMDVVMKLGRGAKMAKIDIKSAFCLCPVHPSDHHLLGMRWREQYFFDPVLPFGLRSAPFIFNCLAEAIEWSARQGGATQVLHYLDNIFVAGTPTQTSAPATSTHSPPSVTTSECPWQRRNERDPPHAWSTWGSSWILRPWRPGSPRTNWRP